MVDPGDARIQPRALPSDFLTLAAIVPAIGALDLAVRQAVDRQERLGLYLDTLIMFLATAAVMTLLFGRLVIGHDVLSGAFLLSFPLACLSLTGAGVIAALATRARPRHGGVYAVLIGTFLLGAGYLPWVANAPAVTPPGSWTNYLFSAGALVLGLGGATFRIDSRTTRRADRVGSFIREALPVAAIAVAVVSLVIVSVSGADSTLVRPLAWGVILTASVRQVLLVRERTRAVD